MAKKTDSRIEAFRDKGMDFITRHFGDMEDALRAFKENGDWDKAVSLYMKLATMVVPSLPTQAAEAAGDAGEPAWKTKIDNAKKTQEK